MCLLEKVMFTWLLFLRATDGVEVWRLSLSESELVRLLATSLANTSRVRVVLQKDIAGAEPETSFVFHIPLI